MKICFHGAARTVTGSKHLLTLDSGLQILLDCGMFQGLGNKTASMNEEFGFDPRAVSYLLLSHAHIDHTGLIPYLVKRGFEGKIYCTEATKELSEILLMDSAEIQCYETNIQNRLREGHNLPAYEPLYKVEDVIASLQLFEVVEYDKPFELAPGVDVVFTNAGHLVGSAAIHLTINENGKTTRLAFTGDIGRYRSVLLQPPAPFAQADYIITESTYGDTLHSIALGGIDPLLNAIKKTCIRKKGRLVIPAFSVGRTQEVLYALNQLEIEHRLPDVPYYVDSPLSKKATDAIKHHMEQFNDRLQQVLLKDDDPFAFKGLKYINTPEESQLLATSTEPCVIISASGTADAGRVKQHIYTTVTDQRNTILFVGYCQEETLGGQLIAGKPSIDIMGEKLEVAAEIEALKSMSAHADSNDICRFLACQEPDKVRKIFLVHGEFSTQKSLAEKLERKDFKHVGIPAMHESFEL